jgi:formiminotetrahydrofolate cyclodeaminase
MRLSADALKQADVVAAHGHQGASSDVGVATALLRAGLEGARLNVEINVGSLADEAYAAAVRTEVAALLRR